MLVKDKKTGEVVGMRYGPAMDAIESGTHEVVNEPADPGEPPVGPEALAEADDIVPVGDDMTKAELEAEAKRRGVEVPSGATKADLIGLLNG